MSTYPRAKPVFTTKSLVPPSVSFVKPDGGEFDSGINTSAAWTEHLQQSSLSDEEHENENDEATIRAPGRRYRNAPGRTRGGRPARALFFFEGKPEFGEICIQAGDELLVLKEEVGDGWSLVDVKGEIGLLPHTYYTVSSHVPIRRILTLHIVYCSVWKSNRDAERDHHNPSFSTTIRSNFTSPTSDDRVVLPKLSTISAGRKDVESFLKLCHIRSRRLGAQWLC